MQAVDDRSKASIFGGRSSGRHVPICRLPDGETLGESSERFVLLIGESR